MNINLVALFRLSVLGPLVSRDKITRGELNKTITELADRTYHIPNSKHSRISRQTITNWYYAWSKQGIDGLIPKKRSDSGKTHLNAELQEHILHLKKANQSRSLNTIILLLEQQSVIGRGSLSRSTLYRFLKSHGLAQRTLNSLEKIERRSFVAEHAGDIWQGDVMHGPTIQTHQGLRKVYLVSLMDDASRFVTHSAFCFSETALDIEGVLKQAILKRGIPKKLIIDNGPAYRSHSLQSICAILGIRLVYSRPYEPQSKGKLERWHRTFRELFLAELNIKSIIDITDLNQRLWAWLDQVYHRRPHQGLNNMTPIERWRQDLVHIRPLNPTDHIDEIFYHRYARKVRKDGTIQWNGQLFEVPFELVCTTLTLVVDPHVNKALWVEDHSGSKLGDVIPLDRIANNHRKRSRPVTQEHNTTDPNSVDLAYQSYCESYQLEGEKK